MDFVFTNEGIDSRADEVCAFLSGPRLGIPVTDYPDYQRWLEKVHHQLKTEDKRALVCLRSGNVIGVALYQLHKDVMGTLEIKNISVRPDARGRFIANFFLRNVEIEGQVDYGLLQQVIVDIKAANLQMLRLLGRHQYSEIGRVDLYGLGAGEDIILRKPLEAIQEI